MHAQHTTTRWLLALAVVASLAVCCCQGRALGRLLAAAPAAQHSGSAVGVSHTPRSCCDEDVPAPTPSPARHDHPCDCKANPTAKSLPDAPVLAPTDAGVVQMLPAPSFEAVPLPLPSPRVIDAPAAPRPPTSLLRQHCALTI